VTPTRLRVALVSADRETRTVLADYLRGAGFDVHACDELAVPSAFKALVLINDPDMASEVLIAHVRTWLKLTKTRVIVVTSRPTALKDLLVAHEDRLRVLAAPAFGWDLVDALRATEPIKPRGA
jgi:DNA-binding response OmpR family regulator